ncbi:pantoate--beta-alanine ligase [Pseudodonghicola flavimaris]|uniref:Pantothenate synthetase n=1 Tax=Pseudodonghicola flavimaris TaxID=3050036 RepID=A0ABT7EWS6_9RHOB|nr:pantoate--beta-alanine ligase [Pseudodonghicola flavimaris]MDK3016800.1 pantoate--beta-alanine ligase [Pseudodonghicola flavimaris]
MTTTLIRKLAEMRELSRGWKAAGESIAVVPTMGALHAGHLSLVQAAKAACDRVIVWIFVNPKQFNSPEDLANYPRTEHQDAEKLAPHAVDAVYVPDVDQVYPPGFATTVSVTGLTDVLCGSHRPGHFDGVATVVSKIFLQTGADRAYFGEKDFQQLQVVRRMARDLDIPIEVVACPTVREASGLAMSSRNQRLSPAGQAVAAGLYAVLRDLAEELEQGSSFHPLEARARARLAAEGFGEVEYLDLRSEDGLQALDHAAVPARLFVAVWVDGVRLIDNIPVAAA